MGGGHCPSLSFVWASSISCVPLILGIRFRVVTLGTLLRQIEFTFLQTEDSALVHVLAGFERSLQNAGPSQRKVCSRGYI